MWICCHHGTALCFWSTLKCSISLLCNQSTETLVGHLQRFRRTFHKCSGLSYIKRALLRNLRYLLVSSSTPLRSFFSHQCVSYSVTVGSATALCPKSVIAASSRLTRPSSMAVFKPSISARVSITMSCGACHIASKAIAFAIYRASS